MLTEQCFADFSKCGRPQVLSQESRPELGRRLFLRVVSARNAIPFLSDPENVLVLGETTFVHDKPLCMMLTRLRITLKAKDLNSGVMIYDQATGLI